MSAKRVIYMQLSQPTDEQVSQAPSNWENFVPDEANIHVQQLHL